MATDLDRLRQGIYDHDVEIFRAGELFEGLISDVLVGDCFHRMTKSQWFKCLSPVVKSVSSFNRDKEWAVRNPTFFMHGMEVLQASPIESLPVVPPKVNRPHLQLDNVEDVEFKELKELK